MAENRRGIAEKRKKIHLLWHGEQQVSASYHFRDTHHGIVNDNGKLVGPSPVGAPENEIAAVARKVDGADAVGAVAERDVTVGDKEAGGRLAPA